MRSKFGDEVYTRRTPEGMVRMYEALAKNETDPFLKQQYMQHAEHYKKRKGEEK